MADTTKQVSMLELELEDDLIRQIEDVADSGCFSKDELLQSILEAWRKNFITIFLINILLNFHNK